MVHLSLTGNGRRRPLKRLGFRLKDGWLRLPVPDVYERLTDKVFYAYTVLALVAKPRMVVKLDAYFDGRLAKADRIHSLLDPDDHRYELSHPQTKHFWEWD